MNPENCYKYERLLTVDKSLNDTNNLILSYSKKGVPHESTEMKVDKFYRYFNRAGIVLWFHKKIGNSLKTFFIFSVSKINDKYIIADFGGQRDLNEDPSKNAFREYVEESTIVSDPDILPTTLPEDYLEKITYFRQKYMI